MEVNVGELLTNLGTWGFSLGGAILVLRTEVKWITEGIKRIHHRLDRLEDRVGMIEDRVDRRHTPPEIAGYNGPERRQARGTP